jgi:hypothetical protein
MGPWLLVYGFNVPSGWAQSYRYISLALQADGLIATYIRDPCYPGDADSGPLHSAAECQSSKIDKSHMQK